MNHPMYRDKDSTAAYSLWKNNRENFERQARDLLRANQIGEEYLPALFNKFRVIRNIERNGNILIDIDGEKWKSKISEKTLSTMKIKDIKLPFTAGAIVDQAISGGYLLFSLESDIFTVVISLNEGEYLDLREDNSVVDVDLIDVCEDKDAPGGIVTISIPSDVVLSEFLKNRRISGMYTYVALSVLMYISAFKDDSTRVKSINMKATKASKKNSIPKHRINKILLYQHEIEHTGSGGGGGGVLTKAHIVRGHWRNQWYSKLEEHKPKWIDPYFKGKGKEEISKVYKVS